MSVPNNNNFPCNSMKHGSPGNNRCDTVHISASELWILKITSKVQMEGSACTAVQGLKHPKCKNLKKQFFLTMGFQVLIKCWKFLVKVLSKPDKKGNKIPKKCSNPNLLKWDTFGSTHKGDTAPPRGGGH